MSPFVYTGCSYFVLASLVIHLLPSFEYCATVRRQFFCNPIHCYSFVMHNDKVTINPFGFCHQQLCSIVAVTQTSILHFCALKGRHGQVCEWSVTNIFHPYCVTEVMIDPCSFVRQKKFKKERKGKKNQKNLHIVKV